MNNKFYSDQKALIDIAISILRKEMPKYKENYQRLFYDKKMPPHIFQPLQALKSKISLKPIYKKVENELNISHKKAKTLVEAFGFSTVINNLDKIKPFMDKKLRINILKQLEKEIFK